MKDNGEMINKMVLEKKYGLTKLFLKEIMLMDLKKVQENLSLQKILHTKEKFMKIKSMELVYTNGLMGKYTMENGNIAEQMEKDYLLILMGKNTKENLKMIKEMDTVL